MKRSIRICLALLPLSVVGLIFLMPQVFRPNVDPRELIERAITAHGGEEIIMKYTTGKTRGRGTMGRPPRQFTREECFRLPDCYRELVRFQASGKLFQSSGILYVDNGVEFDAWHQMGNEIRPFERTTGAERSQIFLTTLRSLVFITSNFESCECSVLPMENVSGIMSFGFRAKWEATCCDYFFAKDNGRLVLARSRMQIDVGLKEPDFKDKTVAVEFQDYQQVQGILFPMRMIRTVDGKESKYEYELVELFSSMDEKEFEFPTPEKLKAIFGLKLGVVRE